MLSDEWLSRYELLENLNIKPCRSVTGTWMRTTGVTAIALLVLRTGELKTPGYCNFLSPKNEVFETKVWANRKEPCHEKTCFAVCAQQRQRGSACVFVRCLDSIVPLVSISEISSHYLAHTCDQT